MAVNKVVYDGSTLIDLTTDTLSVSNQLANGVTAHDRTGTKITGNLAFITYYTGSSAPSSSLGSDGDIYLKTS